MFGIIDIHRKADKHYVVIEVRDGYNISLEITKSQFDAINVNTYFDNVPSVFDECYKPKEQRLIKANDIIDGESLDKLISKMKILVELSREFNIVIRQISKATN